MQTIFVVDDEENIRHLITQYLQNEGFLIEAFASIEDLQKRLVSGYPDMFILDIMLPGQNGLDFCREIREQSGVPVIFISARRKALDRIVGLEIGGDDYLSKPFSPRELVARVRSVFRRGAPSSPEPQIYIESSNIRIYPTEHLVTVNGLEVSLTSKEFELLSLLMKNPKRTFNRQELLDRVWGFDYSGGERAVDDLVKRLRKKLKEHGAKSNINTIWGYGYRLYGQA